LAREIVAAYYQERSIFHPHVTANFVNFASPPNSTRVLGWDTPSATGASSGRYFSPTTVGHLGFTGTSLWIDLERNIGVVLLTNRVYYGREPNPLRAFRPKLHDAIMRSLKACMKSYCAT
jgi:CubicO group peptidase (beta-lactamase class C family)